MVITGSVRLWAVTTALQARERDEKGGHFIVQKRKSKAQETRTDVICLSACHLLL